MRVVVFPFDRFSLFLDGSSPSSVDTFFLFSPRLACKGNLRPFSLMGNGCIGGRGECLFLAGLMFFSPIGNYFFGAPHGFSHKSICALSNIACFSLDFQPAHLRNRGMSHVPSPEERRRGQFGFRE